MNKNVLSSSIAVVLALAAVGCDNWVSEYGEGIALQPGQCQYQSEGYETRSAAQAEGTRVQNILASSDNLAPAVPVQTVNVYRTYYERHKKKDKIRNELFAVQVVFQCKDAEFRTFNQRGFETRTLAENAMNQFIINSARDIQIKVITKKTWGYDTNCRQVCDSNGDNCRTYCDTTYAFEVFYAKVNVVAGSSGGRVGSNSSSNGRAAVDARTQDVLNFIDGVKSVHKLYSNNPVTLDDIYQATGALPMTGEQRDRLTSMYNKLSKISSTSDQKEVKYYEVE